MSEIGLPDLPADVMRVLREVPVILRHAVQMWKTKVGTIYIRFRHPALAREDLHHLLDSVLFARVQATGDGLLVVFDPDVDRAAARAILRNHEDQADVMGEADAA